MKLRDYIGALSRSAAEQSQNKSKRRLIIGAAQVARKSSKKLLKDMAGMSRVIDQENAELSGWADPDEIGTPQGRRNFDACDLRVWLKLADMAGVSSVPAKVVAELSEPELEVLLGQFQIPAHIRDNITKPLVEGLQDASEDALSEMSGFIEEFFPETTPAVNAAEVFARVESALDEIPASWMVRTQYCGSNNLKALVGTGLMEKADDTAMVAPQVEIGGGWVRKGNRRIIDFSDPRFLELGIGGHKPGTTYLARPWIKPARCHEGEDLHRANSPFAGPGRWPSEWRVFVKNGQVTGVANYYGWTGQGATPENAWHAIEAAAMAQQIADKGTELGLSGRYMPHVAIWNSTYDHPQVKAFKTEWPEGGLHCTLDFYEGEDGMVLLEGGPGHMPNGGAHPCAFAGYQVDPDSPSRVSSCNGVAFKCMPHVHLAEVQTWVDGDPQGCIQSWADAVHLAQQHAALTAQQDAFVRRVVPDLSDDPDMVAEPM